jgi:murein DD-endopeptidase MepM/ murein hydrolase activator NlpD
VPTGPHLHFEVWAPDGTKINPLPWLAAHGIRVN